MTHPACSVCGLADEYVIPMNDTFTGRLVSQQHHVPYQCIAALQSALAAEKAAREKAEQEAALTEQARYATQALLNAASRYVPKADTIDGYWRELEEAKEAAEAAVRELREQKP